HRRRATAGPVATEGKAAGASGRWNRGRRSIVGPTDGRRGGAGRPFSLGADRAVPARLGNSRRLLAGGAGRVDFGRPAAGALGRRRLSRLAAAFARRGETVS